MVVEISFKSSRGILQSLSKKLQCDASHADVGREFTTNGQTRRTTEREAGERGRRRKGGSTSVGSDDLTETVSPAYSDNKSIVASCTLNIAYDFARVVVCDAHTHAHIHTHSIRSLASFARDIKREVRVYKTRTREGGREERSWKTIAAGNCLVVHLSSVQHSGGRDSRTHAKVQ